MRYRKNNKYFILIFTLFFAVSVGYAAINRTLNIIGNTEIKENTWNIYFDNISVKNGSVSAAIPVIDTTTKTTVNFNTVLNLPGDYYEFSVDVVNSGTIDAMIESITKTPELTTEQAKYLNYIIEYQNGEQITSKQLVSKNSFVRIKVRVEYRTDLTENDLPTTTETLNLGFTVNYVQSDGTATSVKDNGVFVITANGSLDDIGTIVTIGSEQFYTIGTEGNNVKLFSMYNLYVGGDYYNGIWTPYGDEATGMQDDNMQGFAVGENIRKGTTAFSSDSQKGINYSDYSGSIIEEYVNDYKTKLEEKFYVDVIEARLITYNELISDEIGCSGYSCSNAKSFIYSTSYWSGTPIDVYNVWDVFSDGVLDCDKYDTFRGNGVRPVIVIPKSDVKVEIKPVANGSLDDIGTIVTIGSEQFYTIGTEGDNVKLLSMYNLYVGNQYDDENEIVPLDSPTGKQSEVAKGWFTGYSVTNPVIGITFFSNLNSIYAGSLVEGYVNNYKTILENEYGLEVVDARLITYDELTSEEIGCSAEDKTCSNAPSFILSTSYWTGSVYKDNRIYFVNTKGIFNYNYYDSHFYGVRPVIIISKSLF